MNDYGGLGNQGLAALLMQFGGRMLASGGAGERTTVGLGQALMGGVQDYYTLMDRAERQKRQAKEDAAKELQMQRMQQEVDAANREAAARAKMLGMSDPNVQQTYADTLNASGGVPFATGMTQAPPIPQSMPTPQMPPMQGAGLGQSMINPNWQPPAQVTPQQAGQQGLAQATKEFMMQTASPEVLARMNAPVKPELPDIEIVDIGGQKVAVNKTALQQWAAVNPEKPITDFILNKTESPNAPTTTINLPPQQKEEDQAFGKYLITDVYAPAQKQAQQAKTRNIALNTQLKLLEGGLSTGKILPFQSAASSWLQSFGIASDEAKKLASNTEIFNAKAMELVLESQKDQAGPQTESDARRLESTYASVQNTPDANKFITSLAIAQNEQKIKYANFLRDYRTKNKTLNGAEEAWATSKDGQASIFDNPRLKPWKALAESPATPPATGGWSIKRIE